VALAGSRDGRRRRRGPLHAAAPLGGRHRPGRRPGAAAPGRGHRLPQVRAELRPGGEPDHGVLRQAGGAAPAGRRARAPAGGLPGPAFVGESFKSPAAARPPPPSRRGGGGPPRLSPPPPGGARRPPRGGDTPRRLPDSTSTSTRYRSRTGLTPPIIAYTMDRS